MLPSKERVFLSHFGDRLIAAIRRKNSRVCVGIDIYPGKLPGGLGDPVALAKAIVEATHELAAAFKLQIAFFEQLGLAQAQRALDIIGAAARASDTPLILDGKRNDIATTAQAYAAAYLGGDSPVDALTVNPYLGSDGVQPFVDEAYKHDKGVFVLVKTSNPSSQEIQDLQVKTQDGSTRVYEHVGRLVAQWGHRLCGESGYSSVGAVVGATFPEQAKRLREIMPQTPFLVPGYGAQGATAEDVKHCFDGHGLGAIVNSSRGIVYAYEREPYASRFGERQFDEAARAAASDMKDEINQAIRTSA